MKIDQWDPNWHFAEPQNLQKTTRPKQKIILLNFEQNDQKEASEPDHVMLDRIKMSKTAATAKKWAAQVYWQTGKQGAAKCDPNGRKADLLHKGREGYIRMLDFLVVT